VLYLKRLERGQRRSANFIAFDLAVFDFMSCHEDIVQAFDFGAAGAQFEADVHRNSQQNCGMASQKSSMPSRFEFLKN
jgi:hypothetical protein